ncbi:MAG: hypothetical protein IPM23_18740 [Candidatus Melainabacteria bacterium]|nr:hypothetical protein [Candidatus Melainabacteria bacterium]
MSAHDSKLSPLPDVGDFIFFFILDLLLVVLPNQLFADGSTGWHLVTGDYILDHAAVPHKDLISYTFADKGWVAYEWLFDLAAAGITRAGGLNLLAVVLTCLIGFIFLFVYDRCRKNGCGIAASAFLTVTASLVAAMHWLARPHLVTYAGLIVFTLVLDRFYKGTMRMKTMILILCPTTLIWANCHPAFPLGLVVTGVYILVAACQSRLLARESERRAAFDKALAFGLAILVCSLTSLLNPYGLELHGYILEYLRGQDILKATDEYMSPVFHGGLHATCLELLFIALVAGLAISRERLGKPALLLAMLFAHASLTSVRNMPLFAILITPMIALLWSRTILTKEEPLTAGATGIKRALKQFEEQEALCKMHLAPLAATITLIVVALSGGSVFGRTIISSGFDPKSLPVETLDYVRDHGLVDKPGLNYDNWGGYLCYKLGHRVFIDDRADFYDRQFYVEYSVMMAAGAGWRDYLERSGALWVLFPNTSALTMALKADPHWTLVKSDQASSLFVKKTDRVLSESNKSKWEKSPPSI